MTGPLLLPTWEALAVSRPEIVATMRAYLTQVGSVLRPVVRTGADLALRSLAAFLVEEHPHIRRVADIDRPHIEGYKPRGSRPVPDRTAPGSPRPRSRTGSAHCGCSSSGSTSGAGTTPQPGCRCSTVTCPAKTTPSPRPSTIRPPPNCSAPPKPTSGPSSG